MNEHAVCLFSHRKQHRDTNSLRALILSKCCEMRLRILKTSKNGEDDAGEDGEDEDPGGAHHPLWLLLPLWLALFDLSWTVVSQGVAGIQFGVLPIWWPSCLNLFPGCGGGILLFLRVCPCLLLLIHLVVSQVSVKTSWACTSQPHLLCFICKIDVRLFNTSPVSFVNHVGLLALTCWCKMCFNLNVWK